MRTDRLNELGIYNHQLGQSYRILNNGGVLLYPSDTVWAIGCDAFDEAAVNRIRGIRSLPKQQGLVMLVDSLEMLNRYVHRIHPRIETLMAYHLRPLTVVYDTVMNIPHYATAADGSAAIRIVKDPYCRYLISRLGRPIISTIATTSDNIPAFKEELEDNILKSTDYKLIISRPQSAQKTASQIVRFDENGVLEFIRE